MKISTLKYVLPLFSAAFLTVSFVMPLHLYAFINRNDVDAVINTLLRDDYQASYTAEEVVIFFSESGPTVYRYKVGKLKPHKMRKEKYGLDGRVEEIMVQDAELKIVFYPEKNVTVRSLRVTREESGESKEKLMPLIKDNYGVEFLGNSKISGRSSLLFSIMPRLKGTRPSFKVWLDHETAIPLKTEAYSTSGNLSYVSTLTNVVFNPSFTQEYFVIMVPQETAAYEAVSSAENHSQPDAEKIKAGYINKISGGYVLKEVKDENKGYLQLIYHDGLNSISVFRQDWDNTKIKTIGNIIGEKGKKVEIVNINGFEGIYCSRGSENLMSFVTNNHRYTVVGQVSKEGLIEIAKGLGKGSLEK